MWNRIRGKILTKQVVGIGHVDAQLVDIVDRCALTETGQMQAIIDKCSCGSPRLGSSKMAPHGHTDAAIMTSLNRKLDAGSIGSPLSTAKNEYTKPTICKTSSGTVDDRRRPGTNSGHTGNAVTSQGRRNEANNVKNVQLHRQQQQQQPQRNDGSPRHTTVEPPNDRTEQHKHKANSSESDKNQMKKFEKDKDNSNYTSLNYDANYVRVSPPKMTRRPKRSESSSSTEPEVKLTREAQLLASRMAAAVEAGTMSSEKRGCREPRAPAPGPETVQHVSSDGDSCASSKMYIGSETVTSGGPVAAHVASNRQDEAVVLPVTNKPMESDYMSLVDLQSQLSGTRTTQSVREDTSTGSGGQSQTQEVIRREQDASSSSAIKTTVYNDGESSFLQFTFTVRLDNDVTSRPSPSVVSGTVNIVQPSVSRDSGVVEDMVDEGDAMKPVVTVGLQQGGSVVVATGNSQQQSMLENDDEGFDCVDGAIGAHHVIKLNQLPHTTYVKTESSATDTDDTMYHSLLANDREVCAGLNGTYEGFHQQTDANESIHMSWDEVMMEAKTLGIPLRLPTVAAPSVAAAVAAVPAPCKHTDNHHDYGRRSKSTVTCRSSVARLIDHAGHVAVTLTDSESSCLRCVRGEVSSGSSRGPAAATKTTEQQPQSSRTASPFRERFRFCNLFGRKSSTSKDDGAGSSTSAAVSGTPGSASGSMENNRTGSHHHHHRSTSRHRSQHHHHDLDLDLAQRHDSLMTQTLPLRSTAHRKDRPMTAAILMTSSVAGSPCVVRRRPAAVVAPSNSPRSASTSRAATSTDPSTHVRREHRHTEPNVSCKCLPLPGDNDDGLDEVDGVTCQCTWKTGPSLKRTGKHDSVDYNGSSHVFSPSTVQRSGNGGKLSGNTSTARSDFISSLQELHKRGWYWGPMGFDEAEARLAGLPDGSFLVRDSSDERYILSLSFRSLGGTHHTRIEHCSGMFSFYSQKNGHEASNIVDFISNAVVVSRAGYCLYYLRPRASGLAATPVRLLHPVKRRPASLLELSRMVVQRHVTGQNEATYDQLPVSTELRNYLKNSDYM